MIEKSLSPLVCAAMVATAVMLASGGKHAHSGDNDEQEQVYQRRMSEEILPFAEILEAVRSFIQGEIIEIEFEIDHSVPVYEFKYIDDSGYVREAYIDAGTGEILKDEFD